MVLSVVYSITLSLIIFGSVCVFVVGYKIGFDSLAFIYLGLANFGQLFLLVLLNDQKINHPESIGYSFCMSIAICSFAFFLKKNIFKHSKIKITTEKNNLLKLCFFVFLIIKLIQVFITLNYGWGGARQIAYKQILPLSILADLLQGLAFFYVVLLLQRKKIFPFFWALLISLLSGSKAMVLYFLCDISYISRVVLLKKILKIKSILVLSAISFAISVLLFYKNDLSFFTFSNFLEYRGDIYKYAVDKELKTEVSSLYNPATYFFHHLLKLFGSSAYYRPIGSALFAISHKIDFEEAVGGPITPYCIQIEILLNQFNLVIFALIGIFLGYLAALIFNFGNFLLYSQNLVNMAVGYNFLQSYFLIVDPTIFGYKFVPSFILFILYLLQKERRALLKFL